MPFDKENDKSKAIKHDELELKLKRLDVMILVYITIRLIHSNRIR